MTYKQARADFEALEQIAELYDQVTIMDEVTELMQNPTKAFAQKLYEQSIRLWFWEHGVSEETQAIADRHMINPAHCRH